jgi:hypothetical protein
MKERNEYLAFKKTKALLIGLERNQTLTTWSLITGKIEEQFKIPGDLGLMDY